MILLLKFVGFSVIFGKPVTWVLGLIKLWDGFLILKTLLKTFLKAIEISYYIRNKLLPTPLRSTLKF